MAPLKLYITNMTSLKMVKFPWLKSHGSIEAFTNVKDRVLLFSCFHDWKVMAPLKLLGPEQKKRSLHCVSMTEKSWLHWSFPNASLVTLLKNVSMTEKSWLHWSRDIISYAILMIICFHDWKVMAPLKRLTWMCIRVWKYCFHDWKVMAPLKHYLL